MNPLLIGLLSLLTWLKMVNHWKYYRLVSPESKDRQGDIKDFFFNKVDSDMPFGDVGLTFLKFLLPFFRREVLDTDEPEYSIYRKRILIYISLWWLIAVLAGTLYFTQVW